MSRHRKPQFCPTWCFILAAELGVVLAIAILLAVENARGRL